MKYERPTRKTSHGGVSDLPRNSNWKRQYEQDTQNVWQKFPQDSSTHLKMGRSQREVFAWQLLWLNRVFPHTRMQNAARVFMLANTPSTSVRTQLNVFLHCAKVANGICDTPGNNSRDTGNLQLYFSATAAAETYAICNVLRYVASLFYGACTCENLSSTVCQQFSLQGMANVRALQPNGFSESLISHAASLRPIVEYEYSTLFRVLYGRSCTRDA